MWYLFRTNLYILNEKGEACYFVYLGCASSFILWILVLCYFCVYIYISGTFQIWWYFYPPYLVISTTWYTHNPVQNNNFSIYVIIQDEDTFRIIWYLILHNSSTNKRHTSHHLYNLIIIYPMNTSWSHVTDLCKTHTYTVILRTKYAFILLLYSDFQF